MNLYIHLREEVGTTDRKITLQVFANPYGEAVKLAEATRSGEKSERWSLIQEAAGELFYNKHFAGSNVASPTLGAALTRWALGEGYSNAMEIVEKSKLKGAEGEK